MQAIDGIPDIDEARIQRGEAKTQDIGRPEISDDSPADQRLHDLVAMRRVREGDLAAALRRVAGRRQRQPVVGTAILDEIDDVLEVNAEEFVRSFVQKGGQ